MMQPEKSLSRMRGRGLCRLTGHLFRYIFHLQQDLIELEGMCQISGERAACRTLGCAPIIQHSHRMDQVYF